MKPTPGSKSSIAGRILSCNAGSRRREVMVAGEVQGFSPMHLLEMFSKKCANPSYGVFRRLAVIAQDIMPSYERVDASNIKYVIRTGIDLHGHIVIAAQLCQISLARLRIGPVVEFANKDQDRCVWLRVRITARIQRQSRPERFATDSSGCRSIDGLQYRRAAMRHSQYADTFWGDKGKCGQKSFCTVSIERPREWPCDVVSLETYAVLDTAWTKTIHIEHDIAPIHKPAEPNFVPSRHTAAAVHEDNGRKWPLSIRPIEITCDRLAHLGFEFNAPLFGSLHLQRSWWVDGAFKVNKFAGIGWSGSPNCERQNGAGGNRQ